MNFKSLFCFFFSSLELRELEAKLRAGYMNREIAAQLAEKTARDYKDKVEYRPFYFIFDQLNRVVEYR